MLRYRLHFSFISILRAASKVVPAQQGNHGCHNSCYIQYACYSMSAAVCSASTRSSSKLMLHVFESVMDHIILSFFFFKSLTIPYHSRSHRNPVARTVLAALLSTLCTSARAAQARRQLACNPYDDDAVLLGTGALLERQLYTASTAAAHVQPHCCTLRGQCQL